MGLAPEGHDFAHPWIISAVISALCFVAGFVVLYVSGLWANIQQWADAPFPLYFAILAPVLLGFAGYGVWLLAAKLFRPK